MAQNLRPVVTWVVIGLKGWKVGLSVINELVLMWESMATAGDVDECDSKGVFSVSDFKNLMFVDDYYEHCTTDDPQKYEINPLIKTTLNLNDFVTSLKLPSPLPISTSEEIPMQNMCEIESWKKFSETMNMDYNTDYPRRGKAVIFNHRIFNDRDLSPRNGTELDEKLFIQTLYKMGFDRNDIVVLPDKDKKTIEKTLWTISKQVDHTENDMFLCAIFTHGERNLLYAKDGLYPVSTLWKYFSDEECPSLKGKPKLFFIQACRGMKLDSGQRVRDKTTSRAPPTKDLLDYHDFYDSKENHTSSQTPLLLQLPVIRHVRTRSDGGSTVHRDERKSSLPNNIRSVPTEWHGNEGLSTEVDMDSDLYVREGEETFLPPQFEPDMMVATSCADGHYSFRRPKEGSWFISTWNRVVMAYDNLDNIDVVHLLTEVNCTVAVDQISHVEDPRKSRFDKKKQIPCFNSTLTKRLFFNNVFYNTRL